MNTQPRGLRLLCPQGCGTTLTVPMPTLAEVNELPGDTSPKNLDTLVGRNVVGAISHPDRQAGSSPNRTRAMALRASR
jgi:hypothetical protein